MDIDTRIYHGTSGSAPQWGTVKDIEVATGALIRWDSDRPDQWLTIDELRDVAHTFRGKLIQDIPVANIKPGDWLCHWLSDASAYTEVTGWQDRVVELSKQGLEDVTHRDFMTRGYRPAWLDRQDFSRGLDGRTFILARNCPHRVTTEIGFSPCRKGCRLSICDHCNRSKTVHSVDCGA